MAKKICGGPQHMNINSLSSLSWDEFEMSHIAEIMELIILKVLD
tara:strand:- start:771 stop:902 length:132 start_codon:yes stop_codon:yes gene_type:complete